MSTTSGVLTSLALLVGLVCSANGDAFASEPGSPRSVLHEQGIVDPMERVPHELLNASDLRLRIVFSTGALEQANNGTFIRKSRIPIDTLVEQARGSTDPVVLDLLAQRCDDRSLPCDRLDLLRRWTVADTQNQVAWLDLADTLKRRGDFRGGRDAFLRAAMASTWHDHFDDVARLVAAAMPQDSTPERHLAALVISRTVAGMAVSFRALQTLGSYCREDDRDLREACARILSTMTRDADETMPLTIAPAYAARAGLPISEVRAYQQKADAIHWALGQFVRTTAPSDDVLHPASLAAAIDLQRRLLADGERKTAERYLIDQHIAESDAASRYVATLNAFQIRRREELLQPRP